ncbi:hypothetical protein K438DRAFT_1769125 [Mycena galopus ATCC 62051]|nr:hypothetical protein K438DRAFT_1769125 [Mycena galopus ATCC 62051]
MPTGTLCTEAVTSEMKSVRENLTHEKEVEARANRHTTVDRNWNGGGDRYSERIIRFSTPKTDPLKVEVLGESGVGKGKERGQGMVVVRMKGVTNHRQIFGANLSSLIKAPTVSFTRLMCAELAHQLGCLLGKIGAFRDPHRSEFEKLFTLGKHFKSTSKAIYKDEVAPSGKLLCVLVVIRDVKHPWNYTEVMITRVVCFGRFSTTTWVRLRMLLYI